MMTAFTPYAPRRIPASRRIPLRHCDYHVRVWGGDVSPTVEAPPLVMVHGWMDVGASFQFMVDALSRDRLIVAPDWRGYGLTASPPTDSYSFVDYLGDLDALIDAISPDAPVDLLGHSMGGNVAMTYAGLRPQRVRRLMNLEGFGMPQTRPEQAPTRLSQWLDELKIPQTLSRYADAAGVAQRLMKTNPLLAADKAAWLATHWAAPDADGRWAILGDAAHKRVNPVLSRAEEAVAIWRRISAPVLWVEGDVDSMAFWWKGRYTRAEFEERLAVVPDVTRQVLAQAGHMLHHDQPGRLAAAVEAFLD
jgi:pimeloyl-ACP methyl ester carboxylesterase